MTSGDEATNVLEERYTHSILISLYKNGIQKKTSLLNEISKSSCIGQRVMALEEAGLVKVTVDRFNKNSKWIELTEKGRSITIHILEINFLLKDSCGAQTNGLG